ncbi:signal peptidase I [Bacillus cereus]|uniref:signal peptidase I n=1 Tax=Bacillus thuringiensis TaxID=1428 RepID=UPI0018CD3EE8|nr:signal peptidase I [Bacillus thuringiensis]MEB9335656.1 signal peptidase I [Bacillus cereus]
MKTKFQAIQKKKSTWIEWGKSILFAIIGVAIIKTFIFAPFVVEGASMQPSLFNNDRIIVNKIMMEFSSVKYGDVVVIKKPDDPKYYVKRVIGLLNDTIKVKNGNLYINNKEQKEGYLDHTLLEEYKQLNYPETKIPSRKVFVMGDNRLNSRDSRTGLGDIDVSSIVGKAEFVFYPFNRAQVID